jgi:hypothetical protein
MFSMEKEGQGGGMDFMLDSFQVPGDATNSLVTPSGDEAQRGAQQNTTAGQGA